MPSVGLNIKSTQVLAFDPLELLARLLQHDHLLQVISNKSKLAKYFEYSALPNQQPNLRRINTN